VAVIPQDSYYNDQSHLPLEVRKKTNFDHPDAFDWPLFEQQIADLREGRAIEQPTYSYIVCTRLEETVHVEPKDVIIVEGIMTLYDRELRNLMDLKIFVDAEPDERLLRVITRDIAERDHPLEMLIDKYRNVLKPMHDEFIEPTKQYADIIIPNGGNNERAIRMMKLYIERILGHE
jgi:uridine kinase